MVVRVSKSFVTRWSNLSNLWCKGNNNFFFFVIRLSNLCDLWCNSSVTTSSVSRFM